MKELYAFKSTKMRPGQIPAYLEHTQTSELSVFRMWVNPEVSVDQLHPRFKFWLQHGKSEFDHRETVEFIKRRVFEPGYEGIELVLEQVGIPYYDAWEIFKAYHGRHTSDDLEVELISRTE